MFNREQDVGCFPSLLVLLFVCKMLQMFVVTVRLRWAINGSGLNSDRGEEVKFCCCFRFFVLFFYPLLSTDGEVRLCEVPGERRRRRRKEGRRRSPLD